MIHPILHHDSQPLKADPDLLNNHFISPSKLLLRSTPNSPHALQELINSLLDCSTSSFDLRPVTYCEVLKQLKNLISDCSTDADQIPVTNYRKMAPDFASPLTHIINILFLTIPSPPRGNWQECLQYPKSISQSMLTNTDRLLFFLHFLSDLFSIKY